MHIVFINRTHYKLCMHIHKLFTSEKQLSILEILLFKPQTKIAIRQLAKEASVSPSLVSKTIGILKKFDIVKNGGVDYSATLVRAFKLLINVSKFDQQTISQIKAIVPTAGGIGLYGSWANGTNYADSDLDLWVKAKKQVPDKNILQLRSYLKEKLKTEPSVLILTDDKVKQLREKDFVFYCSLLNSFLLWGESID